MNTTKLKLIREKCIEANPQIEDRLFCDKYQTFSPKDFCDECLRLVAPIRLADVLLALQNTVKDVDEPIITVAQSGGFVALDVATETWEFARSEDKDEIVEWNLHADDLEKQSEQTVEFLYNLLK